MQEKIPEAKNRILYPYVLKASQKLINELKVYYDGVNPMEKFVGTTAYINLKLHQTWGYAVYVLDEWLQGKIGGLIKWQTISHARNFLDLSLFNVGSVALVLNAATGNISLKLHVMFGD